MKQNSAGINAAKSLGLGTSSMATRPGFELWLAQRELGNSERFRQWDGLFGLMLETSGRQGELAGSHWNEFDLDAKEWAMPASRSKNRKERKIPLTSTAIRILRSMMAVADPTEPRVFNKLGKCAASKDTFLQSMTRLGLKHENISSLRKLAKSRMEKRLISLPHSSVAAFFGVSLASEDLMPVGSMPQSKTPAPLSRDHAT